MLEALTGRGRPGAEHGPMRCLNHHVMQQATDRFRSLFSTGKTTSPQSKTTTICLSVSLYSSLTYHSLVMFSCLGFQAFRGLGLHDRLDALNKRLVLGELLLALIMIQPASHYTSDPRRVNQDRGTYHITALVSFVFSLTANFALCFLLQKHMRIPLIKALLIRCFLLPTTGLVFGLLLRHTQSDKLHDDCRPRQVTCTMYADLTRTLKKIVLRNGYTFASTLKIARESYWIYRLCWNSS